MHLPHYPWNIPCVILIGMASWAALGLLVLGMLWVAHRVNEQ